MQGLQGPLGRLALAWRVVFEPRTVADPGLVTGNEPRDRAPSRPLGFVKAFTTLLGQKGTK